MYSEEFEFSLALVKNCGDVIKSAFNVEKKISEKSAPNDLVTETDQLVEKMLIGGLREKFPDTM
jgi:myo-inositol-1(or 4)-monophosphatase